MSAFMSVTEKLHFRNLSLIWRDHSETKTLYFPQGELDPDPFVLINVNMSHTEPACVNTDIVVIYKCWGLVKLSH